MGTANGRIPYMLSPANRVKSKGGAALPETYWTRSPSLQNANCVYAIENGGTVNAWGYPYNEYGIPLMFTLSV